MLRRTHSWPIRAIRVFHLLALFFVPLLACAQQPTIEEDFSYAAAVSASDPAQAMVFFERVKADKNSTPELRCRSTLQIGDCYRSLGCPVYAQKAYEELLDKYSMEFPQHVTAALLGLGEAARLVADDEQALSHFGKAFDNQHATEAQRVLACQRIVEIHTKAGKLAESESATRALLEHEISEVNRVSSLTRLATGYSEHGQLKDAIRIYKDLVKASENPTYQSGAWNNIATLHRELKEFEEAADAYREIISLSPIPNDAYRATLARFTPAQRLTYFTSYFPQLEAQKQIVATYLEAGDYDKAFQEAVTLSNLCRTVPEIYHIGTETVAWVLKAQDGNLVRANAYIAYQNEGPKGKDQKLGTADDLKSPITLPSEREQLAEVYVRRLAEIPPQTSNDHRLRGYFALFAGAPTQALKEFEAAYRKSPMDSPSIQRSVSDLAIAAAAIRGHADYAQSIYEFQQQGPAGPDGKLGTKDDLSNPLASK